MATTVLGKVTGIRLLKAYNEAFAEFLQRFEGLGRSGVGRGCCVMGCVTLVDLGIGKREYTVMVLVCYSSARVRVAALGVVDREAWRVADMARWLDGALSVLSWLA